MFLIMGMKVKLRAVGDGTFHCPRCGGDRHYRRMQARRWFTVFFVPVIPLKELGTLVQCDACGGQFAEDVLQAPTTADLNAALVTAMRATVLAFLTLGDTPRAVAAAMEAVRGAGLPGYGDADLAWDRQTDAGARVQAAVAAVGPGLEPLGRERFLTAALRVPMADGALSAEATELGRRVGAWLGLTAANVEGVLALVRADQAS